MKSGRIIARAAFDRRQVPIIACFNRATEPLGVNFDKLIRTLQKFVDRCVVPIWGTPVRLVRSTGFVKGAWALVFLDDADRKNSLAYHDLTPDRLPISKVFVRTAHRDRQPVSVPASHELVEMLVDPANNLYSTGPNARLLYAYETADPVEGPPRFKLDGIPMTNFVYPSYFEVFRKRGSTQFDYLKRIKRPFQILAYGYQTVLKNGKKKKLFGPKAMRKRGRSAYRPFRRDTSRGHRHGPRCRAARKWGRVVKRY